MRELIVIPYEGKDSERFLQKKFESPKSHIEVLNEYIEQNNIDLDPETSIYIQGVLMAMYNYCVLELVDFNLTAYIPRTLSKAQYNWFNENMREISKCSISAEIMDKDEGIIQIKRQVGPGNNPISRFYSLLESKVEEEVKTDDVRRSK